jgi:hypothetical protein
MLANGIAATVIPQARKVAIDALVIQSPKSEPLKTVRLLYRDAM